MTHEISKNIGKSQQNDENQQNFGNIYWWETILCADKLIHTCKIIKKWPFPIQIYVINTYRHI